MQKESEASKRGRASKRKGYKGEYEVVKILNKYGIEAERVPLSGKLKSEKYSCDVIIKPLNKRIEVKRRKNGAGFKTIRKWLNEDKNSNYLICREDGNTENIVIMPITEFIELLQKKV